MKYFEMIGMNEEIDIRGFSEYCKINHYLTLCILTVILQNSFYIDLKLSWIDEANRKHHYQEQEWIVLIAHSRTSCKIV